MTHAGRDNSIEAYPEVNLSIQTALESRQKWLISVRQVVFYSVEAWKRCKKDMTRCSTEALFCVAGSCRHQQRLVPMKFCRRRMCTSLRTCRSSAWSQGQLNLVHASSPKEFWKFL